MTVLKKGERNFLEQIACKPGSVFSTCYRFARPSFRDSLLVLHTLLTEIVDIPSKVTDSGVARIKIAWWENELSANFAESQHPVVNVLVDQGILNTLNKDLLSKFFDGVFELAAGEPFEDVDALLSVSRSIGGSEALLETAAGDYDGQQKVIAAIGSANFIASLLNDANRQFCNENWWMPMNLRARFGITGASIKGHEGLNEAIQSLAGVAISELLEGIRGVHMVGKQPVSADGHHYLKIKSGILHRRLKKLQRKPASHYENPFGTGEILAAWWLAVRAG